MKLYISFLVIALALSFSHELFSQDDDGEDIKMSNKEWHLKRDQYAVAAITLLSRLEKLNAQIDSLKQLNDSSEATISGCEDMLYALVGATRQEVADFRIKFDETEKYVNGKTLAPSDVENTSYNEITASKIRCLPEFASRFDALKNKIDNFTQAPVKELPENTYLVNEGDNLWSIAMNKYGDPHMWRLIWNANKLRTKNGNLPDENSFDENYFNEVMNPNLIFPGQVLKLPALK